MVKKHTQEEINNKLREAKIMMASRSNVAESRLPIGVSGSSSIVGVPTCGFRVSKDSTK